jgi:hypothetical protein
MDRTVSLPATVAIREMPDPPYVVPRMTERYFDRDSAGGRRYPR